MKDFECVLEGLATAAVDVAVQAPRCLSVIESGPNGADHQFFRLRLHFLVESLQIVFSPVFSAWVPCMAGMYPGIVAIERGGVLLLRLVFVDQNWRSFPLIHCRADPIPVRPPAFRENKDYGPSLKCNVSISRRRVWPDIVTVRFLERLQ